MLSSSWLRSVPSLLLVLGLLATACSGSEDDDGQSPYTGGNLSPSQLCGNIATEQCDRRFSCDSQTDKIDCFGNALDQLRCPAATTAALCAGMAISAQQVASCSNQVKAASCDQVKAGNVAAYAPDCGPCAIRR